MANPNDDERNGASDRIPVEIWHEILKLAISCPLLPHQGDDYRNFQWMSCFDCYQVAAYKDSERIRTKLRLVCRAWGDFLDKYSDRLVQLTTTASHGHWPPIKRWDRVVRVQGPVFDKCGCEKICWRGFSGPRTLHSRALPSAYRTERQRTKDLYIRSLGNSCKAIVFPDYWRDDLMEQEQLNSIVMLADDFRELQPADAARAMIALSRAYKQLTLLDIRIRTLNHPSIGLDLPSLDTLRLVVVGVPPRWRGNSRAPIAVVIGKWILPNVRFLYFDAINVSEVEIRCFDLFLQQLGKSLSTLIMGDVSSMRAEFHPSMFSSNLWSSLIALTTLGLGPRDLLWIAAPEPSLDQTGPINICLDVGKMWFGPSSPAEALTRGFATQWPRHMVGVVTVITRWRNVAAFLKTLRQNYHRHEADGIFGMLEALDMNSTALTDMEGVPYDSRIRSTLLAA